VQTDGVFCLRNNTYPHGIQSITPKNSIFVNMIYRLYNNSNSKALKDAIGKIRLVKSKKINFKEFAGIIPKEEDAVKIQRQMRDGW
jgi:hypothetical protein